MFDNINQIIYKNLTMSVIKSFHVFRFQSLCLIAIAAATALAATACNSMKIPETNPVAVTLTREWKNMQPGQNSIRLSVHVEDGDSKITAGGTFLHPTLMTPVSLALTASDGSTLAAFPSKDVKHTFQSIQIPGMGTDSTRDVDTFDGHNDDGIRIKGTVTSEYAMHYVRESAKNAWLLKAEFDLADSSGPFGHISSSEYVDW